MTEKEKFMREALKQAKRAYEKGEIPVGAVIVKDNKIIARAYNEKEEIQQLQELGISLERKRKTGQEIGQATFDVSVEKCDEAQNVISKLIERQEENKEQK